MRANADPSWKDLKRQNRRAKSVKCNPTLTLLTCRNLEEMSLPITFVKLKIFVGVLTLLIWPQFCLWATIVLFPATLVICLISKNGNIILPLDSSFVTSLGSNFFISSFTLFLLKCCLNCFCYIARIGIMDLELLSMKIDVRNLLFVGMLGMVMSRSRKSITFFQNV